MAHRLATDQLTYKSLHCRLSRDRGKASAHTCVKHAEAGIDKQALDWAQVHGTDGTDIWADYLPLCRRCHMRYDADARPFFFARTEETESIRRTALERSWTYERRSAECAQRARDVSTGRFLVGTS